MWRQNQDELNRESFISKHGYVIVRVSSHFVNAMYRTPDNCLCSAVVTFNPFSGTVTMSLESPVEDVSCRDIVQDLWGDEAGGHTGIAGSPRGRRMFFQDFYKAVEALDRDIVIVNG